MDIETKFNKYVLEYVMLKTEVTQNDRLQLYGLYKQATVGDINIEVPSIFEVLERKKWDSWFYFKGLSLETAKKEYNKYYEYLVNKQIYHNPRQTPI
jgi:diazepam-binding inhibitor (GABA receptor modulating acyl-CoA-binding protein)